jgi:hypothetical protein
LTSMGQIFPLRITRKSISYFFSCFFDLGACI